MVVEACPIFPISSVESTLLTFSKITNLPATFPMPSIKSLRILAPKAGGDSISEVGISAWFKNRVFLAFSSGS